MKDVRPIAISPVAPPESTAAPDVQLASLFALLDDPDPRIAETVTDQIRKRGHDALLPLLTFLDGTIEPLARKRAEELSLQFNTERLNREFSLLKLRLDSSDAAALEDGMYLIAQYGNPALDIRALKSELDSFAQLLGYRIGGLSSSLELLDEVNHFFFDDLHFRGNHVRFMDEENSYIDKVIERRIGIPISLAAIYLLVVQTRLQLPFSGASAPGHFLVRYDGIRAEPLFIDAFNGGTVLRERDIKHYLDGSGLPFHKQFLDPTDARSILLRTIRNLILVFTEHGNMPARKAFEGFMTILAPNAAEGKAFLRGLDG